jgi:hypothetical protein
MTDSESTILAKFWLNVSKVQADTSCWEWTGPRDHYGYGRLRFHGLEWKAHRFAYAHLVGPIPEGLHICHHCDNPPCVRPSHLFPGTQTDNVQDAVAKGRVAMPGHWTGGAPPQGVKHFNARLNDEKVRAIVRLSQIMTYRELAAMFNVSHGTIYPILHGKTWRHVTGLPIPE